jgi:hypothetical protein
MLKLVYYFVNWCARNGLRQDAYKIVIVPQSVEAEARLRTAVHGELTKLYVSGSLDPLEGVVYGVPFKIEKAERH